MTDTAPTPPAPLLEDTTALVARVVELVTRAVGADPSRDAERLTLSVQGAIEQVAVYLDMTDSYATDEDVPVRVINALVALAAGELRRPGFAFGLIGYDEADPTAARAYGAIRADLAPGLKARWGVA